MLVLVMGAVVGVVVVGVVMEKEEEAEALAAGTAAATKDEARPTSSMPAAALKAYGMAKKKEKGGSGRRKGRSEMVEKMREQQNFTGVVTSKNISCYCFWSLSMISCLVGLHSIGIGPPAAKNNQPRNLSGPNPLA